MGPLGRGPTPVVTDCNVKNSSCSGVGPIDNAFLCKSNLCSSNVLICDDNVNICCEKKTNLKLMCKSDSGKRTLKGFTKACNNVDGFNTINSDSSLLSENLLYGPVGQHINENVSLFASHSGMNNLASPSGVDYIEDCCTQATRSDDTYIWPFYGEVENCIVHFTNTYWSDTCGIGTYFVYVQGIQHKGWFLWSQNMYSGQFSVTKCSNPPAGYLQIICIKNVSIIFHEPVSRNQAYLTHELFARQFLLQDLWSFLCNVHGKSNR